MSSQLPVELLTRILIALKPTNTTYLMPYIKDINNCRLVCKQFDEIIITLLFKKGVDLGYRSEDPESCHLNRKAVRACLNRYPHLGTHIRTIYLRSPFIKDSMTISSVYTRLNHKADDTITCWSEDSPLLQLPNVSSLKVKTPFFHRTLQYDGIGPLPTGLRTLLKTYLRSSTLTTISLSHVDDIPTPDIFSSPFLVTADFDNCTFSESVNLTVPTATSLTAISARRHVDAKFPIHDLPFLSKLERIEVVNGLKFYDDHGNAAKVNIAPNTSPTNEPHTFEHLSEIAVHNLNDWNVLLPIGQKCGTQFPALTKLSFGLMMGKQAQANLPLLPYFESPALKELSLFDIGTLAEDYYSTDLHLSEHLLAFKSTIQILSLDWRRAWEHSGVNFDYPILQINQALGRISGENILQTIELVIHIDMKCQRNDRFSPDTTNFEALADVICRPGAFPLLTKVVCKTEVMVHEDKFQGQKKTEAIIRKVLNAAILRFTASRIEFDLKLICEMDSCSSMCYFPSDEEDEEDGGNDDEDEGEGDDDEDDNEEDADDEDS